jgi:hypothetical protein
VAFVPNGNFQRRRIQRGVNRRGTKIPSPRRRSELNRLPVAPEQTKAIRNGRYVPAPQPPASELVVKLIEPHGKAHFVTESEQRVARYLQAAHLEYEYEQREFLVSRADGSHEAMRFRPDFYIPEYNTYLEVTSGESAQSRALARRRRKAAEVHAKYGVTIFIIGPDELRDLSLQGVSILELILQAANDGNDTLTEWLESDAA